MSIIKNFEQLAKDSLGIKANTVDNLLLQKALDFLVIAHYNHRFVNGDFFITHPISVASLLIKEVNIKDIEIICSALLHDVFEKSDIDVEYFKKVFGERIYKNVDVLTKHHWLGVTEKDRMVSYINRLLKAGDECKIIKLADRLDKLRRKITKTQDELTKYIYNTNQYFSMLVNKDSSNDVVFLWGLLSQEIKKNKKF